MNVVEDDGTQRWNQTGDYGSIRIDGVSTYCGSYHFKSMGGEYDMNVLIIMSNLEENTDYRLIYTYQLVQVLHHDQTDIED